MKEFTFKDNLQEMEICFWAKDEEAAWAELCDDFGTGYVFENIEKIA